MSDSLPQVKLLGVLPWHSYRFDIYDTPEGHCVVHGRTIVAKVKDVDRTYAKKNPAAYWRKMFTAYYQDAAFLAETSPSLNARTSRRRAIRRQAGRCSSSTRSIRFRNAQPLSRCLLPYLSAFHP